MPQGRVLSPLSFILHTNDCVSHRANSSLIRPTDHAALVGFEQSPNWSTGVGWTTFRTGVDFKHFKNKRNSDWFFGEKKSSIQPVTLQVVATENAEEYMYLGTVNDSKLTWTANTVAKYTNAQQRLYCKRIIMCLNCRHRNTDFVLHNQCGDVCHPALMSANGMC